jgi:hypothetical protein
LEIIIEICFETAKAVMMDSIEARKTAMLLGKQ